MPPSSHFCLPKGVERVFDTGKGNYTVSVLKKCHDDYTRLKTYFLAQWRKKKHHRGVSLRVKRVLEIRYEHEVWHAFDKSMTQFDTNLVRNPSSASDRNHEPTPESAGRARGREASGRFFYGAALVDGCRFGIDLADGPCADQRCGVCSVVRDAFHPTTPSTPSPPSFQCAGKLNLSVTPHEANEHAIGSERPRDGEYWRCLFLCDVANGHGVLGNQCGILPTHLFVYSYRNLASQHSNQYSAC